MKRVKIKRIVACVLLAAVAGLFALGLSDGGFSDVANKARTVCYECIGLG